MKKLILLVAVFAAFSMLTSCSESKLQKVVEATNKQCPLSMGSLGELASMELEDGNVVLTCNVDEAWINIDVLNENPDLLRRNADVMLRNRTGDIKKLFDVILEGDAGLVMRYRGKDSGKMTTIALSSKEISEIGHSEAGDDMESVLEMQLEVTNAQYPQQIAQGMTITRVTIEDDYVVYNISCDEDLYSISALEENMALIKEELKTNLASEPAADMFVQICKNAGKGVAYRYTGSQSGTSCTVNIEASEL